MSTRRDGQSPLFVPPCGWTLNRSRLHCAYSTIMCVVSRIRDNYSCLLFIPHRVLPMARFRPWKVLLSVVCWALPTASTQAQPGALPEPRFDPETKKWGYGDPTSKAWIAPQFDIARPFSPTERLAAVKVKD